MGHEKRKNSTWEGKESVELEGERETWKIGKATWEGRKKSS
jgi:hypothetical protein